jgi:peroxiredoxin
VADSFIAKPATKIALSFVIVVTTFTWLWVSYPGLQQAPDISLQLIDGSRIKLRELGSNPVLVTFWATTCVTCVKKTPELKALYQKLKPLGFEMIAVAMAYDPPNRILAFSEDHQIPYPIALDLNGSVAKAFNDVLLTPTTFLISADRKIVFTAIGNLNTQVLEDKISSMLMEQNPEITKETS